MRADIFELRLSQIRERIYDGNVSAGVGSLVELLEEKLDPENRVVVLLEICLLSLACGDTEEAAERWEQARAESRLGGCGNSTELSPFDGFFTMVRSSLDDGVSRLSRCILDKPEDFRLYLLRGMGYAQREQYEHALADLERAGSLSADNVIVMSVLADVYAELGMTDRAVDVHERVIEKCPDYRRSLMSLGVIFFDRQQYDSAFRLFQCLVGYDPVNWFAWSCLGDIRMMQQGRSYQALTYYAAAVVSGSQLSHNYLNLARGLYSLGKYRQGLRVLKQFREMYDVVEWPGDDYRSYIFLRLIGECIIDSVHVHSHIHSKMGQLASRLDNGTVMLLWMLSMASGLNYSGTMVQVFRSQVCLFALLAQYMQNCNGRVVDIDETLLLGCLTRMLIWCDLPFEARAILGLLSRSSDVFAVDMTAMLWNEFYAHRRLQMTSAVSLGTFHKLCIEKYGGDRFVENLSLDPNSSLTVHPDLPQAAAHAVLPHRTEELADILFPCSDPKAFGIINGVIDKDRNDFDAFWMLWGEQQKSGKLSDSSQMILKEMGEDICKAFNHLTKVFRASESMSEGTKGYLSGDGIYAEILSALCERAEYKGKLEAANKDDIQVCGQDFDSMSGGYEPLPFALDGQALENILPGKSRPGQLDSGTLSAWLEKWVYRYVFALLREGTDGSISKDLSETDWGGYARRLMGVEEFLHGRKPMSLEPFLDPDGGLDDDFLGLVNVLFSDHPVMRQWMNMVNIQFFPEEGIYLPKVSDFRGSVFVPVVPEFPKCASLLKHPTVSRIVSRDDLFEVCFNRAVLAVENWLSNGENSELDVFFAGQQFFRFRGVSSVRSRRRGRGKKVPASKLFKVPGHLEASNSDHEVSVKMRVSGKHRKGGEERLIGGFISNSAEMGKVLREVTNQLDGHREIREIDVSFIHLVADHSFMEQFVRWAEKLTEHLALEVYEIEGMLEDVERCGSYMVRWRIHDLLGRYPWLSPLYLILAGIHAEQGEEEKALKTIQAGNQWDEKLYKGSGWYPVKGEEEGTQDESLIPVSSLSELEEQRDLLWSERYIFVNNEENMYHYAEMDSGYGMRCRRPVYYPVIMQRMSVGDHRGGYEFYRLFRRFILQDVAFRGAYLEAVSCGGCRDLGGVMSSVIASQRSPEQFPLRRQLSEMLFQLYPSENPGALGRFYCDNMQPANALLYAAYSHLSETSDDRSDDVTHSAVTLGCLFYDMGYMEDAQKYLNRAIRSKNPPPMAYLTLGCVLIEMRKFRQAIKCLEDGLRIDPTSDRFYYNMSLAYIELGMLDQAETAVRSGIELSKFPVDLKLQLGRIYVKRGMYYEALPLMEYVSREDPEMFLSAMKFVDFEEFSRLGAVQALINGIRPGGEE